MISNLRLLAAVTAVAALLTGSLLLPGLPLLAEPTVAGGPSPTSRPDTGTVALPPALTDAQMAPLVKICQKLNQRQWAEPIVETFEKAPAKDKETWKSAQGAMLDYKDGKLVVSTQNGIAIAYRALPAELKGSEAVRVDAWIQIHPMKFPNQQIAAVMYQNSMFIGGDPNAFHQWDYHYMFAVGRGNITHFMMPGGNFNRTAVADAVKPGKLMHLSIELTPQQFCCQRDESQPLKGGFDTAASFKVAADTPVGFSAQLARFAIVQMVYRGLEARKGVDLAEELKATAFKDQPALTRFLAERVVPRLDDPRYPPRQAATDLLVALWPLSEPAVRAAKTGFSQEGLCRLAMLTDFVAPVEVTTTQPEKPLTPPVTKDLPADDKPAAATAKPAKPAVAPASQPAQPEAQPRPRPAAPAGAILNLGPAMKRPGDQIG